MGNLALSLASPKIEKTNLWTEMEIEAEMQQHGGSHPSLLVYHPKDNWGQGSYISYGLPTS
jgi:hypothetical protein